MSEKTLLHVGCGYRDRNYTPKIFQSLEWKHVRVDINPACRPDVVDDITKMTNWEPDSVDGIFSSHNLEHLYPRQAVAALQRFRQILRYGFGVLILHVPDATLAMEHALKYGINSVIYNSEAGPVTPFDMLYGFNPEQDPFMAHKMAITENVMKELLIEAGFFHSTIIRTEYELRVYTKK